MAPRMALLRHKGRDLGLEIGGPVIVLEQGVVLERVRPALDLALCLRVDRGRCGRALFSACSATPRDPLRRMTRRYPTTSAAGERRSSDQAPRAPMPSVAYLECFLIDALRSAVPNESAAGASCDIFALRVWVRKFRCHQAAQAVRQVRGAGDSHECQTQPRSSDSKGRDQLSPAVTRSPSGCYLSDENSSRSRPATSRACDQRAWSRRWRISGWISTVTSTISRSDVSTSDSGSEARLNAGS